MTLPSSIVANTTAVDRCIRSGGCKVGSASATSPLLPEASLHDGTAVLGGTSDRPTITLSFPLGLSLVGSFSPATNSLTFSKLPDIPLTELNLDLTGADGERPFDTSCETGDVTARFTAHTEHSHRESGRLVFTNRCTGEPTVTGAVSGLADRHPKLELTVTHGVNAPRVAAISLDLPLGLSFYRGAVVRDSICAGDVCATTISIHGLGVTGAAVASARLTGGKLLVALDKGASRLQTTTLGPLLTESKALARKISEGQIKALEASVKITDTDRTTTVLTLKLPV